MTPDEAYRAIATAVIVRAYFDIRNGGDEADTAVRDVKSGGLDIWLAALSAEVSAEDFLSAAREARIKRLEKRISWRDKS